MVVSLCSVLAPVLYVTPNSVAVNALGRIGKWHLAVEVLNSMGGGGDGTDKPDAFVYASVINACGKSGKAVEVTACMLSIDIIF